MSKSRYKTVIVGDSGVGKSSIVHYLIYRRFWTYPDATIGSSFYRYERDDIIFDIWDTAGQERFRAVVPLYLRGAALIIFVYDSSNYQSFINVRDYWYQSIKQSLDHPYPVLILVGNKSDIADTEIIKMADEFSVGSSISHHVVSCKEGIGIEEVFSNAANIIKDRGMIGEINRKPERKVSNWSLFDCLKPLWTTS